MNFPSLTESVSGSLPSQLRHETAHARGSTSALYSMSPKNAALL